MTAFSPTFHSPTKGALSFPAVMEDIRAYLEEDPKRHYTLIIGTDGRPAASMDFVTAIVIHRKGCGGRYFWRRHTVGTIHSLREQLYRETTLSLEAADALLKALGKSFLSLHDIEIHIDAGTEGPSREILREVVGMVRGNGFTPKTKPDSYGASKVADRHT